MQIYDNLTDEQLIKLVHNGDNIAQDFLLEKYKNLVRSKARTYFLNGANNEDIIQEGMIGLFKAIRDFNIEKQTIFSSFAELCIKRQIISAVKSSTRQKHMPLTNYISLNKTVYDEGETSLIDVLFSTNQSDPAVMFSQQSEFNEVYENMKNSLSKMENDVLKLYLDGQTYQEIAKSLNKDAKSIDNALQRIKKKLAPQING